MSQIFGNPIMAGGSTKAFAYIIAFYDPGYTCTVTNGSKTLTDSNDSGQTVFAIPYAGTWVVSSSKSEISSITYIINNYQIIEADVASWKIVPSNGIILNGSTLGTGVTLASSNTATKSDDYYTVENTYNRTGGSNLVVDGIYLPSYFNNADVDGINISINTNSSMDAKFDIVAYIEDARGVLMKFSYDAEKSIGRNFKTFTLEKEGQYREIEKNKEYMVNIFVDAYSGYVTANYYFNINKFSFTP